MNVPNSPLLRASPSRASTPTAAAATTTCARDAVELSQDFTPSDHDILCGRSKQSLNHVGNQKFRQVIFDNLDRYESAITKLDKSVVVTSIVDSLRSKCKNGGGFVRYDAAKERYVEIGETLAREKVGHALRDAIKTRNKRIERKRAERKSSMQLKREALFKSQRLLFQESLKSAGETVKDMESLVPEEIEILEENDDDVQIVAPPVTAAFYNVHDGSKEILETPHVARQVTTDNVNDIISPIDLTGDTPTVSNKRVSKKRKAMGDGGYYDITPTPTPQRQVTLDNNDLLQDDNDLIIPNCKLMPLELMPEPTPVVGPGIIKPGIITPRKEIPSHKSIQFSLYDVGLDALDSYVVQRISTLKNADV